MSTRFLICPILAAMLWLLPGLTPAAHAQDDTGGSTPAADAPGDTGATDTATDTAGTDGDGVSDSLWTDLTTYWQTGGPTMYALAFVLVVGLFIVVDRVMLLRRGRIAPHGLADRANKLWLAGDHQQLISMARQDGSTLGKAIAFIVEHRTNPYENIVSGAEDIAAREFELHTRRNYWLMALGTISPLLGLMGTIFGLMGAFATIGVVGSMDDPSALAGDIGEAMVTTAAGLIIAIPFLFLYHLFRSRTGMIASLLSEEVSNIMHAWFLKKEGA